MFRYIALLAVSIGCYLLAFTFSGILFIWFNPSGNDCGLNIFFIVMTMILAFSFAVIALHPRVRVILCFLFNYAPMFWCACIHHPLSVRIFIHVLISWRFSSSCSLFVSPEETIIIWKVKWENTCNLSIQQWKWSPRISTWYKFNLKSAYMLLVSSY